MWYHEAKSPAASKGQYDTALFALVSAWDREGRTACGTPLSLPSCWRSCLALKSITTLSSSLSKSPSHEGRCAQSTINIGLGALRAKQTSWILLFFLKHALVTIQFPVILNEFQNFISCNTEIISLTQSDNGATQRIEMLWFCPSSATSHRTQCKFKRY